MPDPLAAAIRHHQDGRVKEAEALYRQVLAEQPDNPEALHLLGVLLLQRGEARAAPNSHAQLSPGYPRDLPGVDGTMARLWRGANPRTAGAGALR